MRIDSTDQHIDLASSIILRRTQLRFERYRRRTISDMDRLFARLLAGEWLFAVAVAVLFSSRASHSLLAVLLATLVITPAVVLGWKRAGEPLTRDVIAVAQMAVSALLIHLTGGRMESHFHVFASLALLAFYLDSTVMAIAAATIAVNHLVSGLWWPELLWIAGCTLLLVLAGNRRLKEWQGAAEEGGLLEAMSEREWREKSVLERESR
jgi:hypothetical protein